ncbi:MAG: hypothetical protein JRI97_08805, partial [Deltaproteobacteria bacterium]|nr:hypothetical protein [Deltaproteobacteria bacterium]
MTPAEKHKWTFAARFRKNAYGWRSQIPVKRTREAVSEIKKAARKDPVLGAEGAVLFLEKIVPAIEQVDSSSGSMGTAVYHAVKALARIIADAPGDGKFRDQWLDRLWEAVQADGMGYLDNLPEHWGLMCATPERASRWADDLLFTTRTVFESPSFSYFKGTSACLSCLYHAGRHEELLGLLELPRHKFWSDRKWGVKALVALGKRADALRYAEASGEDHWDSGKAAEACEQILLSSGLAKEAYRRYAIRANQKMTHLATFRAIAKKYPAKRP